MELTTADVQQHFKLARPISEIFPWEAHIGTDGRAMLVCSMRFDTKDKEELDAGLLAIALDGDDMALARVPKEIAPQFGFHSGAAAYGDGLILLSRSNSSGETRAALLPRTGMKWGDPQVLKLTPDLPTRVTSGGHNSHVVPENKGIGRGGVVAWPVTAPTGSNDTSVKSVIFVQPDTTSGRLNWSYWREPDNPKSFLGRFFGKAEKAGPQDFVRPDSNGFPKIGYELDVLPNVRSACFDGTRLLIASDGASSRKSIRCAAISQVQPDGAVSHLYMADFVKRPDASKSHDYQPRFVDGGRKALLKSRFNPTDPWKGGFALFDVEDRSLTVYAGFKGEPYEGPREIVGDRALFAKYDDAAGRLTVTLEKMTRK